VQATDWIAVDWGTSNLRAWGVAGDGSVTFSAGSPQGMGTLQRAEYPEALKSLLGPHLDRFSHDVLVCGMAGARQGWIEAPYLDAPTDLAGLAGAGVKPADAPDGLDVTILPGVCVREPGAENVMRGEETQLLGIAALRAGFSGTVCMPGTHSKWARLTGTRIETFSTAMTGELFEVLRSHSVLRHSLDGATDDADSAEGFAKGSAIGLEQPEKLSAALFTVRAASLLSGRSPGWCAGYLSGLLIGAEIGAARDWIAGGPVVIVGSPALGTRYAEVIAAAGGTAERIDAAEATLAGLKKARSSQTGAN
jgi:2-dehydro-3-deoxygalactonokinase